MYTHTTSFLFLFIDCILELNVANIIHKLCSKINCQLEIYNANYRFVLRADSQFWNITIVRYVSYVWYVRLRLRIIRRILLECVSNPTLPMPTFQISFTSASTCTKRALWIHYVHKYFQSITHVTSRLWFCSIICFTKCWFLYF